MGGLVASMMATGLLLVGGMPASAQTAEQISVSSSATTVRPPVLSRARFTCHDEGSIVTLSLRNRSKTEVAYQVRLSGGDVAQAQAVTLGARAVQRVEFHGIPNGRYVIEVLNDAGDHVAHLRVHVNCVSSRCSRSEI
jgi:hypothetical protein